MNCRRYRRERYAAEAGSAGAADAPRSHLHDCASCREWTLTQQLIDRAFADVRRIPAPTLNVAARVAEETRTAAGAPATAPRWTLVALLFSGCGVFFGLWNSGIAVGPSLEVGVRGLAFARGLIETLWSPLATVLEAVGRLGLTLLGALAEATNSLGALEPWFVGLAALCALTMTTSVLLVVGRDIGRRRLR